MRRSGGCCRSQPSGNFRPAPRSARGRGRGSGRGSAHPPRPARAPPSAPTRPPFDVTPHAAGGAFATGGAPLALPAGGTPQPDGTGTDAARMGHATAGADTACTACGSSCAGDSGSAKGARTFAGRLSHPPACAPPLPTSHTPPSTACVSGSPSPRRLAICCCCSCCWVGLRTSALLRWAPRWRLPGAARGGGA